MIVIYSFCIFYILIKKRKLKKNIPWNFSTKIIVKVKSVKMKDKFPKVTVKFDSLAKLTEIFLTFLISNKLF